MIYLMVGYVPSRVKLRNVTVVNAPGFDKMMYVQLDFLGYLAG